MTGDHAAPTYLSALAYRGQHAAPAPLLPDLHVPGRYLAGSAALAVAGGTAALTVSWLGVAPASAAGITDAVHAQSSAPRAAASARSEHAVSAHAPATPAIAAASSSQPEFKAPPVVRAAAVPPAAVTASQPESNGSAEPSGSPQSIAEAMLPAYGWPAAQFGCLDELWTRESGWRVTAENPSGAYGIPQALPGDKMASAGADWATSPVTQIRWGLLYLRDTYGSPCGGWAHELADGWY